MNFFDKISKNRQNLNENEGKILDYFFSNTDKIEKLTIREVCKDNYIVPNTLIRFCKKLGFSGYSEFKTTFKLSVNTTLISDEKTSLDKQVLKTKEILNLETIDSIVTSIYNAKKIIILSFGLSRNVANDLNEHLQMIGLNSHTYIDTNVIEYNCSLLNKDDVLICFSISGETKKVLESINIAKTKGARTVSITEFSSNTLSKLSDFQLYAMISKKSLNGIDLTSRIGFFYISNLIFERYFEKYFVV